MPKIIPSLLQLIGDGFMDDAYAADGNHLRWMFDPRLGFPRIAFCLERRPGLGTEQALVDVTQFVEHFKEAAAPVSEIVRPGVSVSRPGGTMAVSAGGINLEDQPLVLDFHGGSDGDPEPYACWVTLFFMVAVPGGRLQADAEYENRGEFEVVDRQRLNFQTTGLPEIGLRPAEIADVERTLAKTEKLTSLLEQPEVGRAIPFLVEPDARRLYNKLLRANSARYRLVTRGYLHSILDALAERGLNEADLRADLATNEIVQVDLRADRIDRVVVSGSRARLQTVAWVRTENLMDAPDWKPVACFPIPTEEADYQERNQEHIAGLPVEELAAARIFKPLPHGAEPLDDHQVPPSRPPETDELKLRYLLPWFEYLEPWVRQVLDASLAANIHQEEVQLIEPVTEFRQARGLAAHDGVPGMTDRTLEVRPYTALLAASGTFPVARLLGLAAVDIPPLIQDVDIWDYRVRGRWRVPDLVAWDDKLRRELGVLIDQISQATPSERSQLFPQLLEKAFEISTTEVFLDELISDATDDVVELWALKLGIKATKHALFAEPTDLAATFDGLGLPHPSADPSAPEGTTRLAWALRQRARPVFDEEIPVAAVVARDDSRGSGPFPEILNPAHPDTGVTAPIVPAGPPGAPGESGTAVFFDRHAESGTDYRYGVAEVDPFGRWSLFREESFRWDYDIPPAAPAQVSADLDLVDSPPTLQLTVRFAWPTDLHAAEDHSFKIHLRRLAPPSGSPKDPTHWGKFERQPGSDAAPYQFGGTFSGSDSHDGMPVSVAFSDSSVTDPAGNIQAYRDYVLTFTGLVVDRDAIERAQVWVGVTSLDEAHGGLESDEVGGPARAEHVLAVPPPAASLPPDPEQATFADAEGISSYTLEWDGGANVRYAVYRAGERELIIHLQDRGIDTSAYDPDDAPNLRAAALKQLAPQAQDAFQPRSGLVPEPPRYPPGFDPPSLVGEFLEPKDWEDPALGGGPLAAGLRSFTDTLPGQLRTLTVYAVLGRSRSGVLSPWPASGDGFVVVEVPHAPEPGQPVVVRASWQPPETGVERVELFVAEPPAESAAVTSYEVYRTRDPVKSGDYRLMRPLNRLDDPVYETNVAGLEGTSVARYIDPTIAPWRRYYYRVIARAPGGNGTSAGMRSQASGLVQVVTLSGSPPQAPVAITTDRIDDTLQISFEAEAPTTTAGDFFFDVIHLASRGPLILARSTATAARQTEDPNRYLIGVPIEVNGHLLSPTDEIVIRVTDPLGRSTDSAPVSVAQPPDLAGLEVRTIPFLGFLQVQVRSSEPITEPDTGAYVLELFASRIDGPGLEELAHETLHEIGTAPTLGRFVRSGPDADGRHIYTITLSDSPDPIDTVLVRLTDPIGLQSQLSQASP